MTGEDIAPTGGKSSDWSRVDQALEELDRAWQSTAAPSFTHLVPGPGDPLRRLVLVELVKADIEHQWKSGARKLVEAYLEPPWAELKDDPEALAELLEAECFARAAFDVLPTQEELQSRFPEVWQAVDLEEIRAEMETDRGRPDETPSTAQSPLPLEPGTQFGPYRIIELLGRGGMGAVYRAFDTGLGIEVALKIPYVDPATEAVVLERFLSEARMAAQVGHANICPVYHVDQIGGTYYIKMKLIRGRSLADRIEAGPIDAREGAEIVRKVALALDKAHEAGIVHRDIKPSNVMIDESGEPLLTDFGLARLAHAQGAADRAPSAPEGPAQDGSPGETVEREPPQTPSQTQEKVRLTATGCLVGTIPYMPPELAHGREPDMRGDIYSLGVVLYQTLTGRLPFEPKPGEHPAELVQRILDHEPPRPRELRPEVDSRLEAICLKAMAKAPEERLGTARQMALYLQRFRDDKPIRISFPRRMGGMMSWLGRHWPVVWLAIAWLALSVVALSASTFFIRTANTQSGSRRQVAEFPPPESFGKPIPVPGIGHIRDAGSVSLDPSGNFMVFCIESRLYSAEWSKRERNWGNVAPLRLGSGGMGWETTPCVSSDGQWLFYTASPGTPVGGKIYRAQRRADGQWKPGEPIAGKVNRAVDAPAFPMFTGTKLYFSRWLTGDRSDLYQSRYDPVHDTFGNPTPLNRTINDGSYNTAPYVSDDGQTLLFVSTRSGAECVWMAKWNEALSDWDVPTKPDWPINDPPYPFKPWYSAARRTLFFVRGGGPYESEAIGTTPP